MAVYDPDLDTIIEELDTVEFDDDTHTTYDLCIRSYNGGAHTLSITRKTTSANGKVYGKRFPGIPLDEVSALLTTLAEHFEVE